MFLWLGLKLPDEFENRIRQVVLEKNKKFGFSDTSFDLPKHISVKISFESADYQEMMEDIEKNVLVEYEPFSVKTTGIEVNPGIIWIRFENGETITRLHTDILDYLERFHDIKPHEYDLDFIYHTTLIHDEQADIKELEIFAQGLYEELHVDQIFLDTVIFGISDNNQPKTFRIINEKKL